MIRVWFVALYFCSTIYIKSSVYSHVIGSNATWEINTNWRDTEIVWIIMHLQNFKFLERACTELCNLVTRQISIYKRAIMSKSI